MTLALRNVVLAGGTGLVGRRLVGSLFAAGARVTVLTRDPQAARLPQGVTALSWDHLPAALEGADALINLAGEGIADRRWTPARRAELRDSRIDTTARLAAALGQVDRRPPVLVNASAVGFYGRRGGEVVDEGAAQGRGFLPELCQAWERAADEARAHGVRVVKLRFGVVLAQEGGALPKMALPVRLLLGARLGHGQQGLSWIHIDDLAAMIFEAAQNPAWEGVYNATAPRPVTQQTFTEALGRTLHRPILPAPAFLTRMALKVALGRMAQEMLLEGAFVYPRRAEAQGFAFKYPEISMALGELLG
jgi:hypothetical protein